MPDPAVPPGPESAESAGSARVEFTFADLRAVFAVLSGFLPTNPGHDGELAVRSAEIAAALAKVRAVTTRDIGDHHINVQVLPFTVLGGPCGD